MAAVRWGRSELAQGALIPRVRWGRSELNGTVAAGGSKVRWGRSEVAGTANTIGKVRWGRSELGGGGAVVINALNPQTVEPETVVSLTAVLSGGGTADSYTWRRVSGPAVAFIGTGATITFLAPSGMPPGGASVVVGVTATSGGTVSAERTVTITVLPQLRWQLSGTSWVGKRPIVKV